MSSRLSLLMVCTCVQLRGEAGVDPWVEAAQRVAANTAIRDSLFKHYVALVDLATNYNTQDRSNSWRKDQSHIGAQVVESAHTQSCGACRDSHTSHLAMMSFWHQIVA